MSEHEEVDALADSLNPNDPTYQAAKAKGAHALSWVIGVRKRKPTPKNVTAGFGAPINLGVITPILIAVILIALVLKYIVLPALGLF